MRFSILGALLGTVALAGAGGVAITQTSATDSLRFTDTPLHAQQAALAGDPSTSPPSTTPPSTSPSPTETTTPTATPSPTDGDYTAETRVVKRRGVSYLAVSVTYEGAAFFNVDQRVCKRRTCKTASVDLMVVGGDANATTRLGRGTYKKKGQAGVSMAPLPTVTVRETVTVTEPGPTVTVTEPGPTVTETFTCQPYVEPTDTLPPSGEPTGTLTPSVEPTPTPTPTVTETPTDTVSPTVSPTLSPTETPTDTPSEIPTCPAPSETPAEPPTDETPTPTPTDTSVPTDTATATPSESASTPAAQ
ncbi:hypothetical protein HCN51_53510 [Nonomuraea sp. FMUSA5-5]|uniref:Uncharacterized protein n=1 Tax=Nonomuraea composti TaxID=2720023 RepID=A0ABX1BK89_9ACTN|nr:hypothetical protein [Nonomuraea sp. FMUSA5-5]NJP98153.1 hypothetical protein [Nonomuraea sp. FMUSA5-5]